MDNWFFIVGCQRSGTTLAKLILECHSRICCFDEVLAYGLLAAHRVETPAGKTRIGFKIPRWTEQLADERLQDEGLPEVAACFYTGQPIIFVLRDVRDTAVSMLKFRLGDQSWLETWGQRVLEWKITQDSTFRERYQPELKLRAQAQHPLAATGALYWKYKTAAFFEYRSRRWPVLGLPYRWLVSNPLPVLRKVCQFLRVPWESALLNHPACPHGELREHGLAVGGSDPSRRIDTGSLDQWRTYLSPDQVGEILEIAGDLQQRIDELYPPEGATAACWDRLLECFPQVDSATSPPARISESKDTSS